MDMLYEIKNEKFTAQIDTMGAQLVSLKGKNGFEYIWIGLPEYWKEHAPVLFPIVGALRDGKTNIDGRWFEMTRHGFAKRTEFLLAEQSEQSISLKLTANEETKTMYPFDFALTVTYTLTDSGIKTGFEVENAGEDGMPFVVGGHPGFNIPVDESAAFEDYTVVFEKAEDQKCPAIIMETGLIDYGSCGFELKNESEIPLRHSLFYNDALVFEGLNSDKVKIVNKASGKGIEMDFSDFPMLGIWSAKNDGPYVCLEPWTGCATLTHEGDDFRKKKGMTALKSGEKRACAFTVNIL